MLYLRLILFVVLFIGLKVHAHAKPIGSLTKKPSKVIRTCCLFGSDIRIKGVPFIKIDHLIDFKNIGQHKYLGGKTENNGIVYTQRGGFIDLGHLRDQADWTAYIFQLLLTNDSTIYKIGHESGIKTLQFHNIQELNNKDKAMLAAKIAYNLSVWHEISTWYSGSVIPYIPERYSSFSIEDTYSNLLGVLLGSEAVLSKSSYEAAMDSLLYNILLDLEVMDYEQTKTMMESVNNVWWTNLEKLPSEKISISRNMQAFGTISPQLALHHISPYILHEPETSISGKNLNTYFTFSIKVNRRMYNQKDICDIQDKIITQYDLAFLVACISKLTDQGDY